MHNRLGQSEKQHRYAGMEVMGPNVTEFRHATVADCCFSVENRLLRQRLWNLWQHVVARDSSRLRAGLCKSDGLVSVLIIASTGSYFHLMLVSYLASDVPHTKLALQENAVLITSKPGSSRRLLRLSRGDWSLDQKPNGTELFMSTAHISWPLRAPGQNRVLIGL